MNEQSTTTSRPRRRLSLWLILAVLPLLFAAANVKGPVTAVAPEEATVRRINVPYTAQTTNLPITDRSVFWFGKVGPTTSNFADVRTIYNDQQLYITLHVYDRFLWYDIDPTTNTLTDWDSATLYLSESSSGSLGSNQHRFVAQMSTPHRDRPPYQAAYQGQSGGWTSANTPFTTVVGWQGNGLNEPVNQDSGWWISFLVPFSSLGLSGPPPEGTVWQLGVAVHDKDDQAGTPISDRVWPENMAPTSPPTWGELHFGLPDYATPPGAPHGTLVLTDGVDGQTVTDVHVGGTTTCATDLWPDFWAEWGDENRAGDRGFNVQNQFNLGDWPCFSKYYVTIPIDDIPPGESVLSATFTAHFFSNSNVDGTFNGEAKDSLIQASIIDQPWQEETITWNNAPMAVENIAQEWVQPRPQGVPQDWHRVHDWDVTRAVVEAHQAGEPLRLVFYSADNDQHSGKYFRSSEHFDPARRPTLTVVYGSPTINFTDAVYFPIQIR